MMLEVLTVQGSQGREAIVALIHDPDQTRQHACSADRRAQDVAARWEMDNASSTGSDIAGYHLRMPLAGRRAARLARSRSRIWKRTR